METKITRRVREWIAKDQLLAQGMNVIVGYSGGSDSLSELVKALYKFGSSAKTYAQA